MYVTILPACISVCHAHAWCLQGTEEIVHPEICLTVIQVLELKACKTLPSLDLVLLNHYPL